MYIDTWIEPLTMCFTICSYRCPKCNESLAFSFFSWRTVRTIAHCGAQFQHNVHVHLTEDIYLYTNINIYIYKHGSVIFVSISLIGIWKENVVLNSSRQSPCLKGQNVFNSGATAACRHHNSNAYCRRVCCSHFLEKIFFHNGEYSSAVYAFFRGEFQSGCKGCKLEWIKLAQIKFAYFSCERKQKFKTKK